MNAGLVTFVPLALLWLEHPRLGARVDTATLAISLAVLLPAAALTGWRTSIHAKRWRLRQATGWQPVAEAAGTAVAVALAYLARGILSRPADAPAYVLIYGGGALILGALVGSILRATALLVLMLHRRMHQ